MARFHWRRREFDGLFEVVEWTLAPAPAADSGEINRFVCVRVVDDQLAAEFLVRELRSSSGAAP